MTGRKNINCEVHLFEIAIHNRPACWTTMTRFRVHCQHQTRLNTIRIQRINLKNTRKVDNQATKSGGQFLFLTFLHTKDPLYLWKALNDFHFDVWVLNWRSFGSEVMGWADARSEFSKGVDRRTISSRDNINGAFITLEVTYGWGMFLDMIMTVLPVLRFSSKIFLVVFKNI